MPNDPDRERRDAPASSDEPHEERSAAPDNWPGIRGRSAEDEQDDPRGRTEVTEEQRTLEAEVKETLERNDE